MVHTSVLLSLHRENPVRNLVCQLLRGKEIWWQTHHFVRVTEYVAWIHSCVPVWKGDAEASVQTLVLLA